MNLPGIAACDPVSGVARRISLHVIGLSVNYQGSAAIASRKPGIQAFGGNSLLSVAESEPANPTFQPSFHS